ncbi:MAG: hypothetical protein QXT19_04920 [Candidatus Woesearchaeota archaeon]
MRIAIDFDGTIANTYVLQRQFCKEKYGIDFPWFAMTGALRRQYLTEEQVVEVKKYAHGPATLDAPLVPGAREAIQSLVLAGHKIIILTGRVAAGAQSAKEYLKRNKIPYHHFIFVSDDEKRRLADGTILSKNVVVNRLKLDVIIDDQQKGLGSLTSSGVMVIIIDQPWNQQEILQQGVLRVKGWREIAELLLMTPAKV